MTGTTLCVICKEPGHPRAVESIHGRINGYPQPDLCDLCWRDLESDWLLLGWCTDHYGVALHVCPVHGVEIQPL